MKAVVVVVKVMMMRRIRRMGPMKKWRRRQLGAIKGRGGNSNSNLD